MKKLKTALVFQFAWLLFTIFSLSVSAPSISFHNGKNFQTVGGVFKAREGRWIKAKVGLFFNRAAKFNDAGTADVD